MAPFFDRFGWVTAVQAVDPKSDKQFPADFRDEGWDEKSKVQGHLLNRFPARLRKCVEASELKTKKVSDLFPANGVLTRKERQSIRGNMTFIWVLAFILIILPDLCLGLLGERIYNLRSIPSKSFTAVQLVPLILCLHVDQSMFIQFARERLVGPVTTSIGFSPPAFIPALRFLYEDQVPAYIAAIGVFGCLLQVVVQFGERLWYYWLDIRISKNVISDPQLIDDTVSERNRLQSVLDELTTWVNRQPISRTMILRLSLIKRDYGRKISNLNSALPEEKRKIETTHSRAPKIPYAIANGIILFGNSMFYLGAWGSFFQSFAYAVVIEITTILMVLEPHQSVDDIKNFTTNTVAALVGQLFLASIPYRASDGASVENYISFGILLSILLLYVLVISALAIPAIIAAAIVVWQWIIVAAKFIWRCIASPIKAVWQWMFKAARNHDDPIGLVEGPGSV